MRLDIHPRPGQSRRRGISDKPSAAETDGWESCDYIQIPLAVTMDYHSRAKRFAAILLKDLAIAILREIDEEKR